jgi:hypothetical protein
MSIASEITRLQGVKSDILQAISDKGVDVPAGSALDDCPDLIASISGGGGGDIAAIRCTVNQVANYYEIPVDSLIFNTRCTFEIGAYLSVDNTNTIGLFQCHGSEYYPEICLLNYAPNTSNSGARIQSNYSNKIIATLHPKQYKYHDIKLYSTPSDLVLRFTDLSGNVQEFNAGSQITFYTLNKIMLFIGSWTNNDTGQGNEIYYYRVTDENGNVLLDLVPTEQNGVPGFLDNVSGNFYGPLTNDGTFEAVKARQLI